MALDPGVDAAEFLQHHVFASQWQDLVEDLVSRAEYGRRLSAALPAATLALQTAPPGIHELVARQMATGRPDMLREVFEGLVHPREAIIRFSTPRVVLTDDPARELGEKFDHYVDRSFATPEYVEQEIERRIKALLGSLELKLPFRPARVIKPFNPNQAEPMGIYDHGGTWLQRIQRLRKRDLLPHDVLFAVRGPAQSDLKRFAAFQDICRELELEEVKTVADDAQDSIAEFAKG